MTDWDEDSLRDALQQALEEKGTVHPQNNPTGTGRKRYSAPPK